MSDHFRYDFKIQLDFDQHKDLLNDNFTYKPSNDNLVYDISLVFNQIKPEYTKFTIYYEQSEYIFEKLQFLIEHGVNILSLVKPCPNENKWNFPSILDLMESSLINIDESHYYQHDKKPVILTIDKISILDHGRYMHHGRFTLTENAIQHIHKYLRYTYVAFIKDRDPFLIENNNKVVRFGPAEFTLMFEHYYETIINREIIIKRDPYLVITDNSDTITADEIINLGNKICLLMSFFWKKHIDYFHAKARINNISNYRTKELIKHSDAIDDIAGDSYLETKFDNFYNFINCIDYELFLYNETIILDTTTRIIRSKEVDSVSRFMIYYNIIENIRNYCMNTPIKNNKLSIKEEYNFIGTKKSRDNFIKETIKSISSIVEESDKEAFIANASNKVTFIRKTGLIDQFASLISYLELDSNDYPIDFASLIKIRNDIYHGKLPSENIKEYNQHMNILIYDMIAKLITY